MEATKMDVKQFLELAEQYEDEGEHRMSEIAWLGYNCSCPKTLTQIYN